MSWKKVFGGLLVCASAAAAQTAVAQTAVATRPGFDAFEVATIKPTAPDAQGRYIKMLTRNKFVAVQYTLNLLIAAAYDVNPRTISGAPAWAASEHFDIVAVTPGDVQPTHDEQMTMLRSLLLERFNLGFHREKKDFSIYAIEVAKDGPKLKPTATLDQPVTMGPGVVYAQHMSLPGRNASIHDLASLLQRAVLDRPVVDRTGLTGHYDFDLVWAPNNSEFGGDVSAAPETSPSLPLFEAIQQQLGLRLEAMRGPVEAFLVDAAERPSAN